jgi:hypothetical protein
VQWNYKQWLGDNKVLAMDWDARAMHFHLLMLSIQEDPQGSIPDDTDAIRRWLGSPSGSVENDQTWRRVRPQIFAAWLLRDGRWFNDGMVRECERQDRYRKRYENGTKKCGGVLDVVSKVLEVSNSKSKPTSKVKGKFYLPDWIPKKTWQEFEEMRQKMRKPMTDRARELVVNELKNLRDKGNDPQLVLERSILKCWLDVFELPKNTNGNGKAAEKHARDQETISRIYEELHPEDDERPQGSLLKLSTHR